MAFESRPNLKFLGGAGIGRITAGGNTFDLYLTGGSFAWGATKVFQEMAWHTQPDIDSFADLGQLTRIVHSDGPATATAELSWDVDVGQDNLFIEFMKRGAPFDVAIYDGDTGKRYDKAVLQSFTLSSAGGSFISASASFLGFEAPADFSIDIENSPLHKDDNLIGYWNTGIGAYDGHAGMDDVIDWNLSVTYQVTPKYYSNETNNYPGRYRVGTVETQVQVNTYKDITDFFDDDVIHGQAVEIGIGRFQVSGVISGEKQYQFAGVDSPSTFSYTLESCKFMTFGTDHFTGLNVVDDDVVIYDSSNNV